MQDRVRRPRGEAGRGNPMGRGPPALDTRQLAGAASPETRRRSVTVLVVDDQEAFRDAMRELVAATRGFTLIGESASGETAMSAVAELSPQLVLMDVRMPGMGGIETARQLALSHSDLVVILISVEEPELLPLAIRSCGASAFARKQDLRPRVLRQLWEEHGEG
jgi:DNA-binding NarL/FixJ family response regulator